MQRIILATDFGKASENAYRYCLELAAKKRSQIFIAHVYQQQTLARLSDEKRKQHRQEEFEAFRKRIIRFGRLYPGATPPELFAQCQVSTEVEAGRASVKLLELAEKKKADVLVIGAKKHPGLFTKIFGHLAQSLIYTQVSPVLIIPEDFKGGTPQQIGLICLNQQDKKSIADRFRKDGVLATANQACYLLYEDVETSSPAQPSSDIVITAKPFSKLVVELEHTAVDLFVIKSSSIADKNKKEREELIHHLYDHLGVPLLCV